MDGLTREERAAARWAQLVYKYLKLEAIAGLWGAVGGFVQRCRHRGLPWAASAKAAAKAGAKGNGKGKGGAKGNGKGKGGAKGNGKG